VIDETHDPKLRSWVDSANAPGTDFPIQNLPLGVFRSAGSSEAARVGAAIGDQVLDLARAQDAGLLEGAIERDPDLFQGSLNRLMAAGPAVRRALRRRLSELLAERADDAWRAATSAALAPLTKLELLLPAAVGDYTDFYAGIEHAQNVGRMLRPDEPLVPNYKHVPIAYHGRASSVVVSGSGVRRPHGQTRPDDAAAPTYGPTRALDFELELALWVGPGNRLGEPIPIGEAEEHLFGVGLLNDWSARDVQTWEYRPLGPFLARASRPPSRPGW
jgi:fumarylacetoacetase